MSQLQIIKQTHVTIIDYKTNHVTIIDYNTNKQCHNYRLYNKFQISMALNGNTPSLERRQ